MNGDASTDDEIITVGSPLPRIASAKIESARRVRVTWRDGRTVTVDLAPIFESRRLFIPLRESDELFGAMRVNEDGNALEWDGGIELSAAWIERLPPVGMSNDEFRELMSRMGFTLDGMAAALDVSRRQIAAYRDDKPIPNHIALATRYLAERHARPPQ